MRKRWRGLRSLCLAVEGSGMDHPGRSHVTRGRILRRRDEPTVHLLFAVLVAVSALVYASAQGWNRWLDPAQPLAWTYQPRIDLNHVGWPELCLLPGIGEAKARQIILDRSMNGPFQQPEDLGRVPGIGAKTIESARRLLWIDDPHSGINPHDITRLRALE